jgi:hypothetical protein
MLLLAPCLFFSNSTFSREGTPFGGGTHKKTALASGGPLIIRNS